MLLGKILNGNDADESNRERMSLGLDLCSFVVSDVVDNYSLSNDTKSLVWEAYFECGATSHDHNQSKAEEK